MSETKPPLFLSDEAFDLLAVRAPKEVLRGVGVGSFDEAIGTSRERFEEITAALGANGRTQGFIGEEMAGYLRNALGVTILQLDPAEFQARMGYDREDAMNMLRQLAFRTGADVQEDQ